MKRYHVWTIGCQMNVADSRGLAADLEGLGYAWTDDPEAADVVVLNTCVVRQPVEDKVYGRLGSLLKTRRERPGMVVALMGCLVGQGEARRLRSRFPDVDVFLPPATTRPLLDYLRGADLDGAARRHEARSVAGRWAAQDAGLPAPSRLPLQDRGRVVSAHVPIIHGCSWVCTFCIIPARRGPERSRPAEAVVQDVEALVAEGVREVILLGQIVDRYGHDRDDANALPHLLRRLNDVEHLERIRFLTSHPAFLSDELLAAVAELPKVMEQIEIPLQAGHDRTLARMKRGYTVDEYCRLVARVRESVPDPAIHTDIIVGFPGETEEEFEATYRVVEALRLDKVHIAKFSSRPGTVAAKLLVDDVSTGEKERRRRSLDGLQERIRGEINAALVGQSVEVLAEERDGERWRGRTRKNQIVYFEADGDARGHVLDVRVEWAGPWSLVGRSATSAGLDESRHHGPELPLPAGAADGSRRRTPAPSGSLATPPSSRDGAPDAVTRPPSNR